MAFKAEGVDQSLIGELRSHTLRMWPKIERNKKEVMLLKTEYDSCSNETLTTPKPPFKSFIRTCPKLVNGFEISI